MTSNPPPPPPPTYGAVPVEEISARIALRLRERLGEILRQIHLTIDANVPGLAQQRDPAYLVRRSEATEAIVLYSLQALESRGEWVDPHAMVAHVRRAARIGVREALLVRGYLAGQRQLVEFIRQELQAYGKGEAALEQLRQTYRPLIEHIASSIEREYEAEEERIARSPGSRRRKLVQRLLVDDLDEDELKQLGYQVADRWHLALIATGARAEAALQHLTSASGRDLLAVPGEDGTLIGWLGGRTQQSVIDLTRLLPASKRRKISIAIGEPGLGLPGLRQTYEEAQLTMLVARHNPPALTRCVDVLPEVSALRDHRIIDIYRRGYLLPLNQLNGSGQQARRVLRAYFQHGRAVTATANALGVSRGMIEHHLRQVRRVLGDCVNMTGLEIALRLEQFGYTDNGDTPYKPA